MPMANEPSAAVFTRSRREKDIGALLFGSGQRITVEEDVLPVCNSKKEGPLAAGPKHRWRLELGCQLRWCILIGAKAQQRADITNTVQIRVVFHIEQFDVAENRPRQDRFGNVLEFTDLAAANRARRHHMGVKMATRRALDATSVKVLPDQQRLYLTHLE